MWKPHVLSIEETNTRYRLILEVYIIMELK